MARAMVDAVRRIAGGAADALVPLSNDGKSPAVLCAELDAAMGDGPVVVFTDLTSGSCGLAAVTSCRDHTSRVVVSGVNLPMLLDFVFHTDLPLQDVATRAIDKGRDAIARPFAAR
jgi:mannose/fructose-specific phosphotransferase system component IIA